MDCTAKIDHPIYNIGVIHGQRRCGMKERRMDASFIVLLAFLGASY
jgi:hypothetical protein